MTPLQIAEAAFGAVLFALCLAGYIHTSGLLKHADVPEPQDETAVRRYKKKKTRKKLFFAGIIISVWFLIGFVITFFSGRKGGLVIAFEMFSKRVDVFGVSVAETTLNLPKIPGGKKLIYTHISLPLTAIADFEEKGKTDPMFAELAAICKKHNGLWSGEAEKYLLANAKEI